MKVIEVKDKDWRKEASCQTCETKVELEIGDLRRVCDQRDGDAGVWKCPRVRQGELGVHELNPRHIHYLIPAR